MKQENPFANIIPDVKRCEELLAKCNDANERSEQKLKEIRRLLAIKIVAGAFYFAVAALLAAVLPGASSWLCLALFLAVDLGIAAVDGYRVW